MSQGKLELTRLARYNTFYVLYPLGISSEMWLVYKAITPAAQLNPNFGYALWAILAIYVPGIPFLPTLFLGSCLLC
jgi:very-long-chain (3R)-3-hydroxyacyl-CoA dehydratase